VGDQHNQRRDNSGHAGIMPRGNPESFQWTANILHGPQYTLS
jgi:hypothetical protein